MSQNVIPVPDNTTIVLKMHADLALEGWDRAEAGIICRRRDLKIVQLESQKLFISCRDDCFLRLPKNAVVIIEAVGGDMTVRNLDQTLSVRNVGGDLQALDLAGLEVQKVGGDASLYDIAGAVAVRKVGGDLTAYRLGASLRAESGGDAELVRLPGDVQLRSGGDILLGLEKFTDQPVYLHAGGDIEVIVPAAINAALNISSGAEDINISVGGKDHSYDDHTLRTTLGQGGAEISLLAGGDVEVSDEPVDESDYRDELADLESEWKDRLEELKDEQEQPLGGFDTLDEAGAIFRGDSEMLNREINDRVSQAMQRVEEAMKRMNERLAQKGPRVVVAAHPAPIPVVPPVPPVPDVPPAPEAPGNPAPWNPPDAQAFAEEAAPAEASDEERQIILRMLQEKKITAEEADELLLALGS